MVLEMVVPMESSDDVIFSQLPVISKHREPPVQHSPTNVPASCSCPDLWTWNWYDRSPEADLSSDGDPFAIQQRHEGLSGLQHRTVVFHPCWSNGTAAVRGNKALNAFSVHYWEVNIDVT